MKTLYSYIITGLLLITNSCNYPELLKDLELETLKPSSSFKTIKLQAILKGINRSRISEKGFCLKEQGHFTSSLEIPAIEDCDIKTTIHNETFDTCIIIDASTSIQKYNIRSYIIIDSMTIYGNIVEFESISNDDKCPLFTSIQGITGMTLGTVTASATVSQDEYPITEKGLCWNNSSYPDTTENKIIGGNGNGEYTVTIKNIITDKDYYARFYAVNEAGITYSEEVSFTVFSNDYTPVVTSNPTATNITFKSATLGGNISSDKGHPITERGFCWSTKTAPTVDDNKITAGNDAPTGFSATLNELQASTTYYCRAYAINEAGVGYGNTINFRTTANTIRLSTMIATDITKSTATIGGEVISEGDAPVTEKGVCWGFVTTPDKTDHFAITGTGAGSFTKTLTGLQSGARYYYRPYAINKYGIVYGEIKSFIVK